jgi:hypothetical protein
MVKKKFIPKLDYFFTKATLDGHIGVMSRF